jgi:hypothetical protein
MKGIDWLDLTQDINRWGAVVYTEMNLRVPQNTVNLSCLGHISLSGEALLHGVS